MDYKINRNMNGDNLGTYLLQYEVFIYERKFPWFRKSMKSVETFCARRETDGWFLFAKGDSRKLPDLKSAFDAAEEYAQKVIDQYSEER